MNIDVVALLRELEFSIAGGNTRHSWLLRSPEGDVFLVHPAQPVDHLAAHAVRRTGRSQRRYTSHWAQLSNDASTGALDVSFDQLLTIDTFYDIEITWCHEPLKANVQRSIEWCGAT